VLYPSRYIFVGLALAACLAAEAAAVPPAAPQVDPCQQFDTNAVSAAVKGWFGPSVTLNVYPVAGRGSGTCGFSAETPKHFDITIFYAPVANVEMYGFRQPTPADNTPVAGLGDAPSLRRSRTLGTVTNRKTSLFSRAGPCWYSTSPWIRALPSSPRRSLRSSPLRNLCPKCERIPCLNSEAWIPSIYGRSL
jgi:hypothetical protein